MIQTIVLMLLATVVVFVLAKIMKDAKAFTRLMAILAVSALVGAGLKVSASKANTEPEKATVVSTNVTPTQSSITPFVLENTDAYPDSVSQEQVTRDSVETEVEGLPTVNKVVGYLDDS